jgi:hypothetical protein
MKRVQMRSKSEQIKKILSFLKMWKMVDQVFEGKQQFSFEDVKFVMSLNQGHAIASSINKSGYFRREGWTGSTMWELENTVVFRTAGWERSLG